ncbi:MAG: AAA family ATPase [Bacteroidetes bacterium]|nr:AAA family ATPase [Bacteroidota bacterium]
MTYWHIQMQLPEGRDKPPIDSSLMLKEPQPIIGTGDWDNYQHRYFTGEDPRGIKTGDIILVRAGKTILALCRVKSDFYKNPKLTHIYKHDVYRNVEVLEWYKGNNDFPKPVGTLERLTDKNSDSYKVVDDWYQKHKRKQPMNKIIDALRFKKQIILQGPPGTGKTYQAKNVAEQLIRGQVSGDKAAQATYLKDSEQFELIQFHPSYTYEDFVRGIVVESDKEGKPIYKTKDKILAEFARKALENLENSKKEPKTLSKEIKLKRDFDKFCEEVENVIDDQGKYSITNKAQILEVDYESNGFRYDGENWNTRNPYIMKFADILKLYQLGIATQKEVEECQDVSGTARRRPKYYYTILQKFRESIKDGNLPIVDEDIAKRKDFVLVIDEINRANLPSVLGELIYALEYRNEPVQSIYELDEDRALTLPENLYIIGTMNTADRSVGHIDYAIRRRFAFVDILPNKSVISTDKGKALFEQVKALFIKTESDKEVNSDFLSSDFNFEDVQIGHSYFLGEEDKLPMRWEYEIKPILKECQKDGIFKENAKEAIEKIAV